MTATKQKVPNQGFSVQLSKQTAWGGQLGTAQGRALVQHRLKEKRESTTSTWLAQDIFSVASATSYCEPVTDAAQQVVDGLKVKLAKDEAGLAKGHRFGKPIHSSIYLAIHPCAYIYIDMLCTYIYSIPTFQLVSRAHSDISSDENINRCPSFTTNGLISNLHRGTCEMTSAMGCASDFGPMPRIPLLLVLLGVSLVVLVDSELNSP